MTYEVVEDRKYKGEWRVEAMDDDGSFFLVSFSGALARERAEEYARWKREIERSLQEPLP